ncbi:hypothetical protein [Umboniibacter marinipuniceus]|uniref:Uncharacterized protein n=1 Tax=Umboniibacter marinipuniceus TaxID=569599 RepID=A0A3M0A1L6_9GAMM|nr:hypothetical protein [Umboniibacter marinipuniceus]RMA78863.1 hypothetical protein DFR27_2202 [Umboniibacter marinipuniceus]
MNLLIILVVLFASLALLVTITKGTKPPSDQFIAKVRPWLFPLIMLALVIALISHWMK